MDAGAQQAALPAFRDHVFERVRSPEARAGIVPMQRVDFFLRKIEHRFGKRAQLGEPGHEAGNHRGEFAAQRAQRRARRLPARGVDQVGDRLGLRQVESAVEKRAPREFAGLGQPRAGIEHRSEHRLHHHRPAMPLELEDGFAGVGMRRRESTTRCPRRRARRARRGTSEKRPSGSGSCPITLSAICGTAGPDTRTMPIPPRPAGVAMAAMVSGRPGRRYFTAWHGQACRGRTCAGSAIAEGWKGCCSPASTAPGRPGRRRRTC